MRARRTATNDKLLPGNDVRSLSVPDCVAAGQCAPSYLGLAPQELNGLSNASSTDHSSTSARRSACKERRTGRRKGHNKIGTSRNYRVVYLASPDTTRAGVLSWKVAAGSAFRQLTWDMHVICPEERADCRDRQTPPLSGSRVRTRTTAAKP